MNKRETKPPRKIWTVYRQEPFSINRIGWIALDQPATETIPAGDPLAFAYTDPLNSDDDHMAGCRLDALEEFAKHTDAALLSPALVDLRHVGRNDSMFAVPTWLYGVLLEDGGDKDSSNCMFPYHPSCRFHMEARRKLASQPAAVDQNGVPIYPGDLILTDCEDIGRVRDVAGKGDAGRAGVTYDLLIDGGDMDLPKPGAGMSWIASQLTVFLRADGSRPVKPRLKKSRRQIKQEASNGK